MIPKTPRDWLRWIKSLDDRPPKLTKMTKRRIAPLTEITAEVALGMLELHKIGAKEFCLSEIKDRIGRDVSDSSMLFLREKEFATICENSKAGKYWYKLTDFGILESMEIERRLTDLLKKAEIAIERGIAK